MLKIVAFIWFVKQDIQKWLKTKVCSFLWRLWKWTEKKTKNVWPSRAGIWTPDFPSFAWEVRRMRSNLGKEVRISRLYPKMIFVNEKKDKDSDDFFFKVRFRHLKSHLKVKLKNKKLIFEQKYTASWPLLSKLPHWGHATLVFTHYCFYKVFFSLFRKIINLQFLESAKVGNFKVF